MIMKEIMLKNRYALLNIGTFFINIYRFSDLHENIIQPKPILLGIIYN